MTAHMLVTCDGTWPWPAPGDCTAKISRPLRLQPDETLQTLLEIIRAGWSIKDGVALCPTHVRLQATS